MIYEVVSDEPRIASKEYKTQYKAPIIPNPDNEGIWEEYTGTGISIEEHPLKRHINMGVCGNCKSKNVMVIYAKWCVSPHSGDAYWDYEIICNDCGKFTSRSFSEND